MRILWPYVKLPNTYEGLTTKITMKIAFLNDFNLQQYIGGCTITNSLMIKKGKELGYEIIEFNSKDNINPEKDLKDFDLIILNNINMFKEETLRWIIDNTRYMNYIHDYCWCQFRSAQCERCEVECSPAKIFVDLFANSILNVFLSPLHLEVYKRFFGETLRDAIYIPSPLEEGKFYFDEKKQEEKYLFAGIIMAHKGVTQILSYAKSMNIKIDFAGKAISKALIKEIGEKHSYLGEVPFDKMPELYRKYKYFIINPLWDEPFGRTICEAVASGCKLIKFSGTKMTGFESYQLPPEEMVKKCIKSPEIFWKLSKRGK